jgi:hypothetical protein
MFVLQKEEHCHPHKADEDGAKKHRPMPDESVPNLFLARHPMDAIRASKPSLPIISIH